MSRLFQRSKTDRDPLVDIERLLVDYVWTELIEKGCFDQLLRKRRYDFEVNWSFLDISHHLASFERRTRNEPSSSARDKATRKVVRRDLCLFATSFKNSSDIEQSFTFKTERKTTSRCDVSIQKGFKLGGSVDVRLSIPMTSVGAVGAAEGGGEGPGCRITGGLSGELHVTKTTGQSFEEVLTWGVDSQIKVSKNSTTVAELKVIEEEFMADFNMEHVIQADNDVPVYMKDKKTGTILRIVEIPRDNVAEILAEGNGIEQDKDFPNRVKCFTKGTVRAIYGARQVIDIKTYDEKEYHETAKTGPVVQEIE